MRQHFLHLIGFSAAGVAGIAVDLGLFNLLVFAGFESSFANIWAVLGGLLANFAINSLTFIGRKATRAATVANLMRFAVVAIISALYLYLAFELFSEILELETLASLNLLRIAITGSGTIIRFFLMKNWVFNKG